MALPEPLAGTVSRRRFLQLSGAAGAAAFLATSATGVAAATRRPAARTTNTNPGQEATFATEGDFVTLLNTVANLGDFAIYKDFFSSNQYICFTP